MNQKCKLMNCSKIDKLTVKMSQETLQGIV